MFYLEQFSLEKKEPKKNREEAERIMRKYPDRIPVIVTKSLYSNVPEIDKQKYLAPTDLTLGQFQYVIRKRLKLSPEKALFLFINGEIYCPSVLLISIYEKEQDRADGFLHMTYSGENTFGSQSLAPTGGMETGL
jgi:GABA(A) receptor-associated protein